jgi:predicted metal-binding protein
MRETPAAVLDCARMATTRQDGSRSRASVPEKLADTMLCTPPNHVKTAAT